MLTTKTKDSIRELINVKMIALCPSFHDSGSTNLLLL